MTSPTLPRAQQRALGFLKAGPLKRFEHLWTTKNGQFVAHTTIVHLVRRGRAKISADRKLAELAKP
jgi:hypothetical protein